MISVFKLTLAVVCCIRHNRRLNHSLNCADCINIANCMQMMVDLLTVECVIGKIIDLLIQLVHLLSGVQMTISISEC